MLAHTRLWIKSQTLRRRWGAPSLWRSQGEGWGGVLLGCCSCSCSCSCWPASFAAYATPTALPPPFCAAKGRVGERSFWTVAVAVAVALAAVGSLVSRLTPLPQACPLPLAQPRGGLGRGALGSCSCSCSCSCCLASFAAYAAPTRPGSRWERCAYRSSTRPMPLLLISSLAAEITSAE